MVTEQPHAQAQHSRLSANKRGKRLSLLMTCCTLAICAWGWFYPVRYRLLIALLVLLPWVAIVITARSSGLFKVDGKRNDPHPTLAIPFIFPGLILMLRATTDLNLVGWKGALGISMVLAALLTWAARFADASLRAKWGMIALVFLLLMTYGFGAGMEANALLDRSHPSLYRVQATGKRITTGKYRTFDLSLAPWGPKQQGDKVSVARDFYDSVQTGEDVCILLRDGALHVPWYTVHPCTKH